MASIKIDEKIYLLLQNSIRRGHRSMFFVLGEKGTNGIVVLYYLLSKLKSSSKPAVLWCHKTQHKLSLHLNKRLRSLKKKYLANYSLTQDEIFEHFISSTNIHYCHYGDTETLLGKTFGVAVLQDFASLTPNIIARIVETVEGGGMIIFSITNLTSLESLQSLAMDSHSRYITESHPEVCPMFNKRFSLSLKSCKSCLVLDEQLRIVPTYCDPQKYSFEPSEEMREKLATEARTLKKLKKSHSSKLIGKMIALCLTADQVNAVLDFADCLDKKSVSSIVALTAARGRGKSAALGFSVAAAVIQKYSNIYITAPHLENAQILLSFFIKGLQSCDYQEEQDFTIYYSSHVKQSQFITRVEIFKDHKQIVKYLLPTEYHKLGHADLVVIDECAAIQLPLVKSWLTSSKVFMASTINGYEGTGRSLSLKLLSELRNQETPCGSSSNQNFQEITLNEAIRYRAGDEVEAWLNHVLCLNTTIAPYLSGIYPKPEECQLYEINRETLFSYHNVSEKFLQELVALFVASHYKNSPNDLFMMADAPAHHIFCLLPPTDANTNTMPPILCAIQVSFEGGLAKEHIIQEQSFGKRASGDLLPWIISQQFQDNEFPSYLGARVIRIATHPNYQLMGYGKRALHLLCQYYKGVYHEDGSCSEKCNEKALLLRLNELPESKLDYIGVSYGLTLELLRFWKKAGFVPLYLRQTVNELTGEHTCIMVKGLKKVSSKWKIWLQGFWSDFKTRIVNLLPSAFRYLPASLAMNILDEGYVKFQNATNFRKEHILLFFTPCSIQRLNKYSQHSVDYHLIMDLIPTIAKFYFLNYFHHSLSRNEMMILLCIGLQNKSVEETAADLNQESTHILSSLMQLLKKIIWQLHELEKLSNNDQYIGYVQDDKSRLTFRNPNQWSINYETNSRSFKRKSDEVNDYPRKKFNS